MFKLLAAAALALTIAACGAPRPRETLPPMAPPPAELAPTRADIYRIDAAQSELRVLVYRGGPLARLGHNHVMINRALRGQVELGPSLYASSFLWVAPVSAFTVDEPQARQEEGADFGTVVSDDAKAGTFHNMMSAAVLDGAQYPDITLKSIAVQDGAVPAGASAAAPAGSKTWSSALLVTVAVKVKDRESTLQVPVTVQVDSGRVVATGAVELKQSALGLTPYSLMLGALQVEDTMMIKFRITATTP